MMMKLTDGRRLHHKVGILNDYLNNKQESLQCDHIIIDDDGDEVCHT